MIRFVYPNIDEFDRFIGCGRFLTTTPSNAALDTGYEVAEPNVSRISRITTAASLLAPESFEADKLVYEYKDHSSVGLGESLGLAYLFALIQRSRNIRWAGENLDIWCTGTISTNRGEAELQAVFRNQFDIKLIAFLDEPGARLFLLPLANMTQSHLQFCRQRDARTVTLSQCTSLSLQELLTQKTILQLHGHELETVTEWLFPRQIRLQNPRDFTVKIRRANDNAVVGTGLAVSMEGYILTCTHTIELALGRISSRIEADAEVLVYFPNALSGEAKTRRAKLATRLTNFRDDVALLQLIGAPPPIAPESLPVFGDAIESTQHEFRIYGYQRRQHYLAGHAQGKILEPVEPPEELPMSLDPIQLEFESVHRDMSGAALIDTERNLVVGIVSTLGMPFHESTVGLAINARLLTRPPFNLSLGTPPKLQEKVFTAPAVQQTERQAVQQGSIVWQDAPPLLPEWVGRKPLLERLRDDWLRTDIRIACISGFGGEGKSCLTRKWVEELRLGLQPDTPAPDAVFGWNFYHNPNSDRFFDAVFRFLTADTLSPQDHQSAAMKAHVITGHLYSGRRYLFVLDGLEVMQHHDEDHYGELRNTELRDFLIAFSSPGHRSFCLISSRLPVSDLIQYTTYSQHNISSLHTDEGKILLRKLGVSADEYSDDELERILAQWGGHALTLSLVARYIIERHAVPESTMGESIYEGVSRILQFYERGMSAEEQAFMVLFSAFRLPVEQSAFECLFRRVLVPENFNTIARDVDFVRVAERLVSSHLLRFDSESGHYDTHALVKQHYREFLSQYPKVITIQRHIRDYYLENAGHMPEHPTLKELTPLIEAVYHSCQANEYDRAYSILRQNINKGNRFLLPDELGSWDTYLTVMLDLFPEADVCQDPSLSSPEHVSNILHEVGFCLMMLGRLSEVESFYRRALAITLSLEKWQRASSSYQNLMEVYTQTGQLEAASDASLQAVVIARKAQNKEEERNALADQAWAFHLRGELTAATETFQEAGNLTKQIPEQAEPQVYSLHISRYAEHLRRIEDIALSQKLAEMNLKTCHDKGWQDYESLSYCMLGAINAESGNHSLARSNYEKALRIIRNLTRRDILIEILSSQGRWLAQHQQDPQSAFNTLNEALSYAVDCGYRLYEADIRVGLAWAYLTQTSTTSVVTERQNPICIMNARSQVDRVLRMSEEMGYYWGKIDAEILKRRFNEL